MKLVACMPVRDEAWVLGFSLRVALMWCDEVVVLQHACKDDSARIIADVWREYPGRITRIVNGCSTWFEMIHRQEMLDVARHRGATHIAIVDADEVLTGDLSPIDDYIEELSVGAILQLPGYNLRGGLNRYHNNGVWGNRWFSTAFADAPNLSWTGDQFHHREPFTGGEPLKPYRPVQQGQGGVLHCWGASERRLIARHAWYKCTEALRWPNKPREEIDRMYSWAIKGDPNEAAYGTPATWTYTDVPESWLAPYSHLMKYLDIDAEPWQEAEVRWLVGKHGRERFSGLDLFGIA